MSTSNEAPGVVQRLEGELDALSAENAYGRVLVCRQGGHVVEYVPARHPAVLFVSKKSHFRPDTAIRGGIPICFPWFGPHPTNPERPGHGFARTREFRYLGSQSTPEGGTTLRFALASDSVTRKLWPFDFELEYLVTLERALSLRLVVVNTGVVPFEYEEALHSYFAVSDVRRTPVVGLQGASYLDQLTGSVTEDASPLLEVGGEVDRIYASSASCRIVDAALGREVVLHKHASGTTIVWNPWIDKSRRLADFGDEEYLGMICVESGNAREARVRLEPGKRHEMSLTLESLRLDGESAPR